MRNFKDESFIAQYLSPRLIREFHLFADRRPQRRGARCKVDSIHDEHGYRRVRKLLAQQHAQEIRVPDVQVVRYDRDGDRSLTLRHIRRRGRPLNDAAQKSSRTCAGCGASRCGWKPGKTTPASATPLECAA